MLRIILGYRTGERSETPKVLYAGPDGDAAQAAVDAADEKKFPVVRQANVVNTIRCRRRPAVAAEVVGETAADLAASTDDELAELAAVYGLTVPEPYDREALIKAITAAAAAA